MKKQETAKQQQQAQQSQHLVPVETDKIQRILEDNAAILKVITEKQGSGRWDECEKYVRSPPLPVSFRANRPFFSAGYSFCFPASLSADTSGWCTRT